MLIKDQIIDRTGEEKLNNFGSRIVIVRYKNAHDIDVYFPEYNWTAKNRKYIEFDNGKIKCPYEKRSCNKGYIGEGEYKVKINGKKTICYEVWNSMMRRCYSDKIHKKQPTYIGCEVCEEWLCFQNFAKWYYDNYYEIPNEKMCLDKDILCKGNRIYCPEYCCFVPNNINVLFTKRQSKRGEYPIGVNYHKASGKFVSQCNDGEKRIHLGLYSTPKDAFNAYKIFKENHIKNMADKYKIYLPQQVYDSLYKYEVDIND